VSTPPSPARTAPAPATHVDVERPDVLVNRELSWLGFARRVLALVGNPDLPLLERVKFAGIMGTLHDEFAMKRLSGMKRRISHGSSKRSRDGQTSDQLLLACREELLRQEAVLTRVLEEDLRPRLAAEGGPILDWTALDAEQQSVLRHYFALSLQPILTPLAVDKEHPFPLISSQNLNLAVQLTGKSGKGRRFVRIKVPDNRPRWVALPGGVGYTPIEQVIAANLDRLFPASEEWTVHPFRVTRGAEAREEDEGDLSMEEASREPGSIVRLVVSELKARRFAGVVRLQVSRTMPDDLLEWLAGQLQVRPEDVYRESSLLGLSDLLSYQIPGREDLRYPAHRPVDHPRLARFQRDDPGAIFTEIKRGDLLVHLPYMSYESSVIRFLQAAAVDPSVLAIKLTIYRTSRDSPAVRTLAEAARRGKQVAVIVEITARFDEAPNIAWGQYLEQEGVHVSYGVESLKTHVKLALVVREESGAIKRYAHIGTGNYHSGTARIYEDVGLFTADPQVCEDVATVFNSLTGSTASDGCQRMLVAPRAMRSRFIDLIRRETGHAREGRPAGIKAKMNQLQDQQIIEELYAASRAGVPITLYVRGLNCLRPGVPGQSENIRVASVIGRFLEHSRIYRFENAGEPQFFLGSADWMKRNLDRRVETVVPVLDPQVRAQLDGILRTYDLDNTSAWDCRPTGEYVRRRPAEGEERRSAQEIFIQRAEAGGGG
jgi:polyphosphate kinase